MFLGLHLYVVGGLAFHLYTKVRQLLTLFILCESSKSNKHSLTYL